MSKRPAGEAAQGVAKKMKRDLDDEHNEFLTDNIEEIADEILNDIREARNVKSEVRAQLLANHLRKSMENVLTLAEESDIIAHYVQEGSMVEAVENAIEYLTETFRLPAFYRYGSTSTPIQFVPVDDPTPVELRLSTIELSCPLCFDKVNPRRTRHAGNNLVITNCRHAIHEGCLKKWLINKHVCPQGCGRRVRWVATDIVNGIEYVKNEIHIVL